MQRVDVVRDVLALRDLLLAAEARRSRFAPVWRASADELGDVEHRRQRREHGAAVQAAEQRDGGLDRVAAEQDHHVARLHAEPAARRADSARPRGAARRR